MKKSFFWIFLIACLPVLVSGEPKTIGLPLETSTFKPGPGADLVSAQCYTCHSVEYVTTQPPMPRKFWETTVVKMKEKFGAPIPDSSVQGLTDYLTDNYGLK